MKLRIFYTKPETFSQFSAFSGNTPTSDKLTETHTEICTIEVGGLEEAFSRMQGEHWSPEGEARDLIEITGVYHTSMSVGDVVVDADTGAVFAVADVGFKPIGTIPANFPPPIVAEPMPDNRIDRNRWFLAAVQKYRP